MGPIKPELVFLDDILSVTWGFFLRGFEVVPYSIAGCLPERSGSWRLDMGKGNRERAGKRAMDEGMTAVVDRNINALLARKREEERTKGIQDRLADIITRFTGSMVFVYLHLLFFGFWILINTGLFPIMPAFDPTMVILAMIASVEAIFLSTFVLISQNRMQALADKRAELSLHISLLAEHEVTRIIKLLTAIGLRLGVDESQNPELRELAKDVAPEKVLDRMNEMEKSETPPSE